MRVQKYKYLITVGLFFFFFAVLFSFSYKRFCIFFQRGLWRPWGHYMEHNDLADFYNADYDEDGKLDLYELWIMIVEAGLPEYVAFEMAQQQMRHDLDNDDKLNKFGKFKIYMYMLETILLHNFLREHPFKLKGGGYGFLGRKKFCWQIWLKKKNLSMKWAEKNILLP